ncbi:RNA 2',3'-cyclic phosphodiesterase [Haladaptatus sp. T7]|uniref:RNA 2',3'-cyclic phosphodiesterase n=1 Tax=Haladaptatus sp. T7 TaxID=2029368 RepID=UPI0021A25B52|nr:RNA 2',3'-cyclic phosphodiesterase [Haladaptatus sp. T7]GKZ15136.1 RNA 2',3'-cyclic phosphodiesterase [Haladaptatus sp. T7]
MRLFVSIDLPDDLAESVDGVQDRFRDADGLSFTDPRQAHVTLSFLGEVDDDRVPVVEDALESAVDDDIDFGPFEAEVCGLGVFPSLEYIRVVWVGVGDGAEEMVLLNDAVESRLYDLGFAPDDDEFVPHITIARMKHAGGKELVQRNVRELDPTVGRMDVSEVRLTKSELGANGPSYSTVAAFPL